MYSAFAFLQKNIIPPTGFAKNIVTDGLILYLDAGIATSNPGGSTWYDLSGNGYDFSLFGGASFGGSGSTAYLLFNGGANYAQITNSTIAQIGSLTAATYQSYIRPVRADQCDILSTNGIGADGSILLMLYQQDKVRNHLWTNGGIGVPDNVNGGNIILNTNQGVGGGWSWTGSPLIYAFREGQTKVSVTPSGTQPTSAYTKLNIGTRTDAAFGSVFEGRMYNLVAYNRLLTDAELAQNFTALTV